MKEQRENKFFVAYSQDPWRTAESEEKAKPETGIRTAKANAYSKALGVRVKPWAGSPARV